MIEKNNTAARIVNHKNQRYTKIILSSIRITCGQLSFVRAGSMARKSKPKSAVAQPPVKKKIVKVSEIGVIKRSLKAAVKEPYSEPFDNNSKDSERVWSPIRTEIERIVIEMTRVLKVGSLNIHVSLNDLIRNGLRNEIVAEFTKTITKDYFSDYFRGMQMIGGQSVGFKLHQEVHRLCLEYAIAPPDIEGIGNMFVYATQRYYINFMNNICTHAYTRIRKFFYSGLQHAALLVSRQLGEDT